MVSVEMEDELKDCVLCWLATVDAEGMPNVSPKEIFTLYRRTHLLIANIASPSSVKNINENSLVCVSAINIVKQRGYKYKGVAKNLWPTDQGYDERFAILYALAGPNFPIRSIIEVEIREVFPIVAPSYRLYPEITESALVENALKTYGVSFDR